MKEKNQDLWSNQLKIERDNPVRIFHGTFFKDKKIDKSYKSTRLKLKKELKN